MATLLEQTARKLTLLTGISATETEIQDAIAYPDYFNGPVLASITSTLQGLPEDNLIAICKYLDEIGIRDVKPLVWSDLLWDNDPRDVKPLEWRSLLWDIEKQGLLKIVPRVYIPQGTIPVLQLSHNTWLSWFRGYRYQVSGSANGIADRGSSDTSLQYDTRIGRGLIQLGDQYLPLARGLIYSHVLEAANMLPSFNEVEQDNPELISELLNLTYQSVESFPELVCQDWSNLSCVSVQQGVPRPDALLEIPIVVEHRKVQYLLGILSFGEGIVCFDDESNGTHYSVSFPPLEDITNVYYSSAHTSTTYRQEMWRRLKFLLLHKAGLWINGLGCGRIDTACPYNRAQVGMACLGGQDIDTKIYEYCESNPVHDEDQ